MTHRVWVFYSLQALQYLDQLGIVHRDIALRNILMTGNKTVKLSDFGLAVRVTPGAEYWSRQEVPTPYKWSAPESLSEAVYSAKSDVWSLGVLLWEMFSLAKDPWPQVRN